MNRPLLFWLLAILITIATAYYQRSTGPTQPKSEQITVGDLNYVLSCPRSLLTEITPEQAQGDWENLHHTSTLTIKVKAKEGVASLPAGTSIRVHYKRARSHSNEDVAEGVVGVDGHIQAILPSQPPAGKWAYYLEIDGVAISKETPIVVRFRNSVPAWALILHILCMFAAMLLSTLCGLLALQNQNRWKKYAWMSVVILLAGGLILGPLIQKYAFGAYWTGWPLGDDLTDTKTLIAAALWIIVLLFSRKKYSRWLAILAAFALLAVFSIPHSASGSEFNYETGFVETEK
jgi:hypothetical protein